METTAVQAAASGLNSIQGPQPILSLSELVSMMDVIKNRENIDKQKLESITTVDEIDLRNRLISWGASGFTSAYALYTIQLDRLEKCSDGVVRDDVIDYVRYLCPNTTLANMLNDLEVRLPGMALSYSYTNDFILRIHVSQKA